jgi:hypothetical protein
MHGERAQAHQLLFVQVDLGAGRGAEVHPRPLARSSSVEAPKSQLKSLPAVDPQGKSQPIRAL